MCEQSLKFVALPVPEIIGVPKKFWEVSDYAHAPFSPKFSWFLVRMDAVNVPAKFEVRSFTPSYRPSIELFLYMCTRFAAIFDWSFG